MELALLILLMALVTYATRLSMIFILGRWQVSPTITRALAFVPMAAFSAIIAPELFLRDGQFTLMHARFFAGAMAIIVAAIARRTMLTIIVGMGALWLIQLLIH